MGSLPSWQSSFQAAQRLQSEAAPNVGPGPGWCARVGGFLSCSASKMLEISCRFKKASGKLGELQLMLILSASVLDVKLKSWSPGVVKVERGTWLRIPRQFSDFIGSGTK